MATATATKNYAKTYEERLMAQKAAILGNKIVEKLELKALANRKLEELYQAMENVVHKPVYEDFNYRTGKILGVLRYIFQNPKNRKELLEITGLSQAHIDLYYEVCGNLPYVNTKTNTLNMGRPMDCESTKELIQATGSTLGVLVEDSDLLDINEDRWNRLYESALADAKKTIEFNESNQVVAYEE